MIFPISHVILFFSPVYFNSDICLSIPILLIHLVPSALHLITVVPAFLLGLIKIYWQRLLTAKPEHNIYCQKKCCVSCRWVGGIDRRHAFIRCGICVLIKQLLAGESAQECPIWRLQVLI